MALKSIIQKYATFFSLATIVLLALALRLYRLDLQSLWVDEIASMNGADPSQSWSQVVAYSVSDQPPAFFLLLHAWFKVFPYNDFYGRLLSVGVAISGIIAMYFLGREVKDKRTGLYAALITTFSFIHILFSQEVRFYTLLFLFSIVSYYFLIRSYKTRTLGNFLFYSLSTALLIYTHYFGLVVFGSQGLIFLVLAFRYPADRKLILLSVSSALLVTVLVIPWMPTFFSEAQIKDFWIQPEPFYFPIKYFYVYFKDVVSCVVFGSLILFYCFKLYRQFRSTPLDPTELILVCWAAFSFLIPLAYSIVQTPLLHVRYTLIALPAVILMICLGLQQLRVTLQRTLLVVTCTTSLFSLVVIEKYYSAIRKEDWRGMVREVLASGAPTDEVVSPQAWYCNYYFRSLGSPRRAILPEQFKPEIQKPSAIWWLDGFNLRPAPDAKELDLAKWGYSPSQTDSLYRARITYYQLSLP